MGAQRVLTVGGYGFSETVFFNRLREHAVDTFIDVRQRRGIRGSKYAFLNSLRLQARLKQEDIKYIHAVDLAPTASVREAQKIADQQFGVQKRDRSKLSDIFINKYNSDVLAEFRPEVLLREVEKSRVIVLFCVEGPPAACHRSIAAERLSQILGVDQPVGHLRP